MALEQIYIIVGILLFVSVIASKLSSRFGIPGFLICLIIGMLSGSEGIGGIYFENYSIAQITGDIALIFILFSGGLDTKWQSMKPVLGQGLILSTLGVVVTMITIGTFAWLILGSFSSFQIGLRGIRWEEGLLLGAIVSSTDAAAVFSVLKSSNLKLKGNLQPLLELESGSNDPMAVLLTMTVINIVAETGDSLANIFFTLLLQIIVGVLIGYGGGLFIVWTNNILKLGSKGLYPVASLARVLLIYGVTVVCQGNGFLAMYVAGIVVGNRDFAYKEIIIDFHEGIAWLMEITMFLVLGLLVFPSQLIDIAPVAIVIAIFLILVARPVSILLCTAFTPYNWSEKFFISWVGLRGSVPIILAIAPIIQGIEGATVIFNVVFFIVLLSVLIQGLTLVPIAKLLKLDT